MNIIYSFINSIECMGLIGFIEIYFSRIEKYWNWSFFLKILCFDCRGFFGCLDKFWENWGNIHEQK